MATDPGTIDFLFDQLGPRAAHWSTKRMFGEYCLYRDGLPVAFVCDDVLFVKDTADGRDAVAAAMPPEFGAPYPGAKPHLRIAPDRWDDGDRLLDVLERTAAALPPRRPRGPEPPAQPKPARAPKAAKTSTPTPAVPRVTKARVPRPRST